MFILSRHKKMASFNLDDIEDRFEEVEEEAVKCDPDQVKLEQHIDERRKEYLKQEASEATKKPKEAKYTKDAKDTKDTKNENDKVKEALNIINDIKKANTCKLCSDSDAKREWLKNAEKSANEESDSDESLNLDDDEEYDDKKSIKDSEPLETNDQKAKITPVNIENVENLTIKILINM